MATKEARVGMTTVWVEKHLMKEVDKRVGVGRRSRLVRELILAWLEGSGAEPRDLAIELDVWKQP